MLQAEADLTAARGSAAAEAYEWACFQAQQAGEKALKALWFCRDFDPWVHSIVKLIEDFPDESLRKDMMALMTKARMLDRLYVPTRYPNGLPDLAPTEAFGADDADLAIRNASDIVEFARMRLP